MPYNVEQSLVLEFQDPSWGEARRAGPSGMEWWWRKRPQEVESSPLDEKGHPHVRSHDLGSISQKPVFGASRLSSTLSPKSFLASFKLYLILLNPNLGGCAIWHVYISTYSSWQWELQPGKQALHFPNQDRDWSWMFLVGGWGWVRERRQCGKNIGSLMPDI